MEASSTDRRVLIPLPNVAGWTGEGSSEDSPELVEVFAKSNKAEVERLQRRMFIKQQ
jgi:hypothetical protein